MLLMIGRCGYCGHVRETGRLVGVFVMGNTLNDIALSVVVVGCVGLLQLVSRIFPDRNQDLFYIAGLCSIVRVYFKDQNRQLV